MKTSLAILIAVTSTIILASCTADPTTPTPSKSVEDGYLILSSDHMFIKDYLTNPDTSTHHRSDSIPVTMNYTDHILTVSQLDIGTPISYKAPFRIVSENQIVFDQATSPDSLALRSVDYRFLIDRVTATYHYEENQMVIIFKQRSYEYTNGYDGSRMLNYNIGHTRDTIRVPRERSH